MYVINWDCPIDGKCEYMADSWEGAQEKIFRLVCRGFTVIVRIV